MFERGIPDLTDSVKTIFSWCMRHDVLEREVRKYYLCSFKVFCLVNLI